MTPNIGGQRPRPRVALLGSVGADDFQQFQRMFPTIWRRPTWYDLRKAVNVAEVDVMIIGRGIDYAGAWPDQVHVICFSDEIGRLPGPTPGTHTGTSGHADSEEFLLPDIPLSWSRQRQADLGQLSSVRGWRRLAILAEPGSSSAITKAWAALRGGAIILEHQTNMPLAAAYLRRGSKLGVAWFPYTPVNEAAWVELLLTEWAQSDPQRLPDFQDWRASPDWMLQEEREIVSEIEALEEDKRTFIARVDRQIGERTAALAAAKVRADNGPRQLVTAQGDVLLNEVARVFTQIGFAVESVDQTLPPGTPRREDLRLTDPSDPTQRWQAIVEVRGYARSSGKTADLQKIHRHASLYRRQHATLPNKRIYVINGEVELLPTQRQQPLASAQEDIEEFAQCDGLIIWTLDLFRAVNAPNPTPSSALLRSIKEGVGRWVPPPPVPTKRR